MAREQDKLSEHEAEEELDKVEVALGSMGHVDVEIIDNRSRAIDERWSRASSMDSEDHKMSAKEQESTSFIIGICI